MNQVECKGRIEYVNSVEDALELVKEHCGDDLAEYINEKMEILNEQKEELASAAIALRNEMQDFVHMVESVCYNGGTE